MIEVRYATEAGTATCRTTTSSPAGEVAAKVQLRELLHQGPEHRKAATPTKTRRKPSSTPLDPSIESPSLPMKTASTRSTAKPTAPAAKQDGDTPTAPSKRPSPPGRPFVKGNTMQKRRSLSAAEVRTVTKQVLTRASVRKILRRMVAVAAAGPPREALGAARLLLDLAGAGEVTTGNAAPSGELHPPVIVLTEPPAR